MWNIVQLILGEQMVIFHIVVLSFSVLLGTSMHPRRESDTTCLLRDPREVVMMI